MIFRGVQEITVKKLNRVTKNKNICCVGCGKRMFQLLELYKQENFICNICMILDNNSNLWGKEIVVRNKAIKIQNPKILKNVDPEKLVVLITSDHWESIYQSIEGYLNEDIRVYQYPRIYSLLVKVFLKLGSFFIIENQILFRAGDEPHENADEIVYYLQEINKKTTYKGIYMVNDKKERTLDIKYIELNTLRKKASIFSVFYCCMAYARSKYLAYENEPIKKVNNKEI